MERMASLRASVRRSESVNSAIFTFHSVVKLGPDFRVHLLPSPDVPKECCSVQIKHITLNLMPICSTMCSVLTLATLAVMVKNRCAKPVLEHWSVETCHCKLKTMVYEGYRIGSIKPATKGFLSMALHVWLQNPIRNYLMHWIPIKHL